MFITSLVCYVGYAHYLTGQAQGNLLASFQHIQLFVSIYN